MLNWIVWKKTVYMSKMDLALNNLQWLICHKAKLNKTKPVQSDGEVLFLESKKMWSTLSILSGPLWLGFVVFVRAASMSRIELFNHLL